MFPIPLFSSFQHRNGVGRHSDGSFLCVFFFTLAWSFEQQSRNTLICFAFFCKIGTAREDLDDLDICLNGLARR